MKVDSREIVIEGINPQDLFGINNVNLKHIKSFFPKLSVLSRGNSLTVQGDQELVEEFNRKFDLIQQHYNTYNVLSINNIDNLMLENGSILFNNGHDDETLVHGTGGNKIKARTVNQKKLVKAIDEYDMVFAVGPAGTGKTYTAVALAVRALKAKEVKRIVLTRPAVEAGENLGFLPGDLKEKLDPYLMPLYDALRDMIPPDKLANMIEMGIIEIAPLAFMRGRTLDKAFVILDEAQNTTTLQMKMFLTRMGMTAKFLITGDMTQVDLPHRQKSGLSFALEILDGIDDDTELTYLEQKELYDNYKAKGQIEFVTFHQSFSYEDFVEGIRAETNDGVISYSVKDGIFKKIAIEALFSKLELSGDKLEAAWKKVIDTNNVIVNKKITAETKFDPKDSDHKKLILAVHKRSDFIEGKGEPYVLIIDEINRGNTSRIFGELITVQF